MQKFEFSAPFEIKAVKTDNGSEFLGEFDGYLDKQNITHYFTYPNSPKCMQPIQYIVFEILLNYNIIMSNGGFSEKTLESKQDQISKTFETISGAVSGAFEDKAKEYAERIKMGEDPKEMGVPLSIQPLVREQLGTPESANDRVEATEVSSDLDFGDDYDKHGGVTPTAVRVGEEDSTKAYERGAEISRGSSEVSPEVSAQISSIVDVIGAVPQETNPLNITLDERKTIDATRENAQVMIRNFLDRSETPEQRQALRDELESIGQVKVYDDVVTEIFIEQEQQDNDEFQAEFGFSPESVFVPDSVEMEGLARDFTQVVAEAEKLGIATDELYHILAPIISHLNTIDSGAKSFWVAENLVKSYYRGVARLNRTRQIISQMNNPPF